VPFGAIPVAAVVGVDDRALDQIGEPAWTTDADRARQLRERLERLLVEVRATRAERQQRIAEENRAPLPDGSAGT
jgi:hypothetical protein